MSRKFLALITRHKDEPFLKQFCLYYISQGIDDIYIIDDNSKDKETLKELDFYLEEYIRTNTVTTILIGLPLKMNQKNTDATSLVIAFKLKLMKKYPEINVVMYDERFSSLIAKKSMIEGNYKKSDRRKKEKVDVIAATIILQDYIRSLEIKDHQKHK